LHPELSKIKAIKLGDLQLNAERQILFVKTRSFNGEDYLVELSKYARKFFILIVTPNMKKHQHLEMFNRQAEKLLFYCKDSFE
jgi:hypothetical protein